MTGVNIYVKVKPKPQECRLHSFVYRLLIIFQVLHKMDIKRVFKIRLINIKNAIYF